MNDNSMNDNSMNLAAVIASNSFYVGGNWGFVLKENEEYEKIINILKSINNGGINLLEVSNGMIVFCNTQYLANAINQVDPISTDVWNKQNTRLKSEILEFQKFLTGILRGNSKYGEKRNGYIEYNIGLYSCNNLHKMRVNGIEYPAYSLSIVEAVKEIIKLKNHLDIYISTKDSFISLNEINNLNDINKLSEGLEISNTLTGVFLTIRVVN